MNPSATASRDLLRAIARRAMLERGLLPDFSPAVLAETAAITTATTSAGGTIRDFRSLLWASIDNDDSRDLDQLSVAQPLVGGAVRILVAIADFGLHRRRHFPDAARKALDRSHVARRGA